MRIDPSRGGGFDGEPMRPLKPPVLSRRTTVGGEIELVIAIVALVASVVVFAVYML